MGIENLYIARVTDGLILVASMEHGAGSADKMDLFKNQVRLEIHLGKKIISLLNIFESIIDQ